MAKEKKERKKLSKPVKITIISVVSALVFVFLLNIVILPLTGGCKRVDGMTTYDGDNQYINFDDRTLLSAHRAGGDLAPEETMAAFVQCIENEADSYSVDIVEFDLHLTKDGVLVLMHDHEVDRTSNGAEKFGKRTTVEELTLAQLKTLNFGYNFKDPDGNYPYRDLKDDEVPDEVRILTLDEILTYLAAKGPKDLKYIIEIKDGGDIGKKAMDKLVDAMKKYGIIDRTIVGTFKGDITRYIDQKYSKEVKRSASILEVLNFYFAFLWGVKQNPDKLGFDVLQIPMGLDGFYDFSTKAFIDYAHATGIAVQYWTINDKDDVAKLQKNGADAIMTDNPAMAYEVLNH